MKLYKVTITAFVMAEDKDAAMWEAHRADPTACDVDIIEPKSLPKRWAAVYPFGGDGIATCRDELTLTRKG